MVIRIKLVDHKRIYTCKMYSPLILRLFYLYWSNLALNRSSGLVFDSEGPQGDVPIHSENPWQVKGQWERQEGVGEEGQEGQEGQKGELVVVVGDLVSVAFSAHIHSHTAPRLPFIYRVRKDLPMADPCGSDGKDGQLPMPLFNGMPDLKVLHF